MTYCCDAELGKCVAKIRAMQYGSTSGSAIIDVHCYLFQHTSMPYSKRSRISEPSEGSGSGQQGRPRKKKNQSSGFQNVGASMSNVSARTKDAPTVLTMHTQHIEQTSKTIQSTYFSTSHTHYIPVYTTPSEQIIDDDNDTSWFTIPDVDVSGEIAPDSFVAPIKVSRATRIRRKAIYRVCTNISTLLVSQAVPGSK
jgi:hypothetical protein